ncbi:MAG: NAD(P)H-binding protein [Casimicrobium sp.]
MAKIAVVAGATGLTGSTLLRQLAGDTRFDRVVALVRSAKREMPTRVESVVVDFEVLANGPEAITIDHAVSDELVVFCCLGTTIKVAGSQAAFRRVDFDYVVAVGRWAKAQHAVHFGLISALGASAKSSVFYTRTKGEAEDTVRALGLCSVLIVRPSFIDGDRTESRPGESVAIRFARGISPLLLGPLRRYRVVTAEAIAASLLAAATSPVAGVTVTESEAI